jgi:hypothetical protein
MRKPAVPRTVRPDRHEPRRRDRRWRRGLRARYSHPEAALRGRCHCRRREPRPAWHSGGAGRGFPRTVARRTPVSRRAAAARRSACRGCRTIWTLTRRQGQLGPLRVLRRLFSPGLGRRRGRPEGRVSVGGAMECWLRVLWLRIGVGSTWNSHWLTSHGLRVDFSLSHQGIAAQGMQAQPPRGWWVQAASPVHSQSFVQVSSAVWQK